MLATTLGVVMAWVVRRRGVLLLRLDVFQRWKQAGQLRDCIGLGRDLVMTVVDPEQEGLWCQRAADAITLRNVTAELQESCLYLVVLDALGNHGQSQVLAEIDRRAHDDVVVLILHQVEYERAVNFEFRNGEVPQIDQG